MRIIYLTHLRSKGYVKGKHDKYILNKNSEANVFRLCQRQKNNKNNDNLFLRI